MFRCSILWYNTPVCRPDVAGLKKQMVQAAQNAIVAALRTWEGIFQLTASGTSHRGIQSVVQMLFLPHNTHAQVEL